jgi:hypothetical protein
MAKASSIKKFLTELATDPEKLGQFILDPDRVLRAAKIDKKHWLHIKNAVAHDVHQKLVATPDSYALML